MALYDPFSAFTQHNNDENKSNEAQIMNDNDEEHNNSVRLICISDTHDMHHGLTDELKKLYQSPNDILLHAGDVSEHGTMDELLDVDKWFGQLPYKHIYVISGNMDGMGLQHDINGYELYKNATYLQHELCELKLPHLNNYRLKIFGSPYTPKFYGGFQINNDKHGKKLWKQVPANIDIFISHGPPKGVLDRTSRGYSVGDKVLYDEVINRIKPKVMIFGHVHPSHSRYDDKKNNIIFANVAQHDKLKGMRDARKHSPIVIDLHIQID